MIRIGQYEVMHKNALDCSFTEYKGRENPASPQTAFPKGKQDMTGQQREVCNRTRIMHIITYGCGYFYPYTEIFSGSQCKETMFAMLQVTVKSVPRKYEKKCDKTTKKL